MDSSETLWTSQAYSRKPYKTNKEVYSLEWFLKFPRGVITLYPGRIVFVPKRTGPTITHTTNEVSEVVLYKNAGVISATVIVTYKDGYIYKHRLIGKHWNWPNEALRQIFVSAGFPTRIVKK